MNDTLVISAVKIAGSVALLALVLWGVSRLTRIAKLDAELGRKLVHISLGLYCLTFPFVFSQAWEVAITCALALGIFLLARGTMRQSLGAGLHGVARTSYGELLFAVSVALLFWLKDGHFIALVHGRPQMGAALYVVPILILTLCDAASALVGIALWQAHLPRREAQSIEGVVVFAVTAWLVSLIAFLLLTDIGRSEVILLAFITAAFGALLEAASWRGLDNLFIPLGLYFLLANLMHLGVIGLAIRAGIFFLALLVIIWLTPRARADRHAVAIGFTLFFCIAIFSGFESLLTPAVAVAMYFACVQWLKVERPPHDNLNLLLVVLAVALAFFLVSHLRSMDTIFGFNVAFAALAAGIVSRFTNKGLIVTGAIVVAWLAMTVRTVWIEGPREQTFVFALLGLGGILALALAGAVLRERKIERPWMMLGGLSAAMGLVALPGLADVTAPEPMNIPGASLAIYREAPTLHGVRTAALGSFECDTAERGATLIREALARLRAEGFGAVLGPMDGNTWGRHRLVVESDGSRPFMLEPQNPLHCVQAFDQSGLKVVSRWVSAVRPSDIPPSESAPPSGIALRNFDLSRAEEELTRIHALSLEQFASNHFYAPIALKAFLDSYRPVLPAIDPELVLLAEDQAGELKAFLFAFPNYSEGPKPQAVILKTYASQVKGGGSLLANAFHARARERGFANVIHALMHETNLSARHSDKTGGKVFRRYALWGDEL